MMGESTFAQELRRQCQQFAVDLLDQTRSSEELAVILNHEQYPKCDVDVCESDTAVQLPLLHLAIKYKQKKVSGGGRRRIRRPLRAGGRTRPRPRMPFASR